jgi:pyruvate-ferredoxin/flavodoxin oxidoreductase
LADEGKNPFSLDSRPPKRPLSEYINNESRYTMLTRSKPEAAKALHALAQKDVEAKWRAYQQLAARPTNGAGSTKA